MLFNIERANYVVSVLRTVDRLGGDADQELSLTERCDECGRKADPLDPHDPHVVGKLGLRRYMIIGCEGYWHIDPGKVDVESPNWEPSPRLAGKLTPRIPDAVEKASEAFWDAIAAAFPEILTGDTDPIEAFTFEQAATRAVEAWVSANRHDDDEDGFTDN